MFSADIASMKSAERLPEQVLKDPRQIFSVATGAVVLIKGGIDGAVHRAPLASDRRLRLNLKASA